MAQIWWFTGTPTTALLMARRPPVFRCTTWQSPCFRPSMPRRGIACSTSNSPCLEVGATRWSTFLILHSALRLACPDWTGLAPRRTKETCYETRQLIVGRTFGFLCTPPSTRNYSLKGKQRNVEYATECIASNCGGECDSGPTHEND